MLKVNISQIAFQILTSSIPGPQFFFSCFDPYGCYIAINHHVKPLRHILISKPSQLFYTCFQCYMHRRHLSICHLLTWYVTWPTSKCEHNGLLYGWTWLLVIKDGFIWHQTSIKALANEDTLLRKQCCRHKCFPICLHAQHFPICLHAQHFLWTQVLCSGHKKCFWFCSETFCVCNKCFPVCAAQETSRATMSMRQCVLIYQGL